MDESGAYTLKKDAHESNDSWLSSITTHDIKKAQAAQAARNEREKAAALSAGPELDKVALLKQAIDILQPGENAVRVRAFERKRRQQNFSFEPNCLRRRILGTKAARRIASVGGTAACSKEERVRGVVVVGGGPRGWQAL